MDFCPKCESMIFPSTKKCSCGYETNSSESFEIGNLNYTKKPEDNINSHKETLYDKKHFFFNNKKNYSKSY